MSAWRLIPPGEKVVAVGGGGGRKYGLSATPVFVAGRAIRGVGAPMVTLGGQKSNNALAFTESRGPRGWRFQERSSDKLTALESARPRVCHSHIKAPTPLSCLRNKSWRFRTAAVYANTHRDDPTITELDFWLNGLQYRVDLGPLSNGLQPWAPLGQAGARV